MKQSDIISRKWSLCWLLHCQLRPCFWSSVGWVGWEIIYHVTKVSNRTHGKLLYNDLDPNYGTEPWTRCLIWGKEQFSINRIWASLWTGSGFYTTWPWSPETRPYFRFQKSRGSCRSWTQRSSGSSSSWIAGFRSPSNHSVTWSINLSLQSFAAWLLGMHFKIIELLWDFWCWE